FGLKVRKLKKHVVKQKVEDVLKKVRLEQFIDRQVSQLSGGQQQRVALARALVIEPDILLLDEPLSNLDARLRDEMRTEILRLQREYDITTIYVTHDQVEALTMSDRIAVFNVGECQQVGTPTEIYNQPVNDFVAEFIGETNILPVEKDKEEGPNFIYKSNDLNESIHVNNSDENIASYEDDNQLYMSVRPEAVKVDEKPMEGINVFSGTVESVQFTGESVHTFVNINENATIKATELNRGPSTYLIEGAEVYAYLPESQVRIIPESKGDV